MKGTYAYAELHLVELADIAGGGEIVEITRDGLPSMLLMLSTASEPEPQSVTHNDDKFANGLNRGGNA